jgi:hypothetical protein
MAFDNEAGYSDWAPYLTMLGGGMQFGASMASGGANAALARANAAVAGMQATSENQAGAEQAELYRQHLNATLGKQAAQVGGANLTMSGSALRSLNTTQELGARDIAQIQLNAARKAWGFQVQQQGDLARAGWDQRAGLMSGLGSLITSGSRAYGQWGEGS